jgi:hypothetical protein
MFEGAGMATRVRINAAQMIFLAPTGMHTAVGWDKRFDVVHAIFHLNQ